MKEMRIKNKLLRSHPAKFYQIILAITEWRMENGEHQKQ